LREILPPHMIPANITVLSEIPLTPHGKLDRNSLPAPADATSRQVILPRTQQEELLAEVWSDLLHQEQVGVDDNFFELGGDSLLSIELVSRLGQRDWRCTPAQVFQHQSLSELAAVLVPCSPQEDETELDQGDVPLTPIQHWFFDLDLENPSYFNQSLLLDVPSGLRPRCLKKAVAALVEHHGVLRMRSRRDADRWRQWMADEATATPFVSFDLSGQSDSQQDVDIDQHSADAQASLDLEMGPIMRAVHFELGKHRSSRLLLSLHHLVVDPYSWRILLDDLLSAYQQASAAQRIMLPPKTTSFASWARRLSLIADDSRVKDSIDYWTEELQADTSNHPPRDISDGDNRSDSADVVRVALSSAETSEFLHLASKGPDSAVAHLSTALAIAHRKWATAPVLVDIERHGRDPIDEGVDVSRTVGWFVAMHPLLLDHHDDQPESATLDRIEQRLSDVPDRGVSFGLLRYLSSDPDFRARLSTTQADVRLNYLGRLDQVGRGHSQLQIHARQYGNQQAPDSLRPHLLEIDARISGDTLVVDLTYSNNVHHRHSVEQLSQHFVAALRRLLSTSA
jgi:non-ribosomal peptide synthase protein (TIGR01720 family)